MPEKTKLGEMLLEAGLIDEFQLTAALGEQARWGNHLGETLVHLGYLTETDLVRALAYHHGFPAIQLEGKQVEPEVLALLPVEVAEEYQCIPLFKSRVGGGEVLYLGMAHPEDLRIIDDVSFRAGLPVRPVVVGPVQLRASISAFYRGEGPRLLEEEDAAALAETPVSDGDTAPVLSDPEEVVSGSCSETGLEVASEDVDAASEDVDAASEDVDAASCDVEAEVVATPLPSVEKPRDVPTRDILHALTQLLIEKDVVGREELVERVALNKKRSAG